MYASQSAAGVLAADEVATPGEVTSAAGDCLPRLERRQAFEVITSAGGDGDCAVDGCSR